MAEMVRVNTRISSRLNEWLDKESEETGIPKSTIVMLALEQYARDREALTHMKNMDSLQGTLQALVQQINEMKQQ